MITFLDGPAKGEALALQRAPLLLRVTRTPAGKFDGLDQLKDSPRADETIFVYILNDPGGKKAFVHMDGRDPKTKKRYGIWTMIASYRLYEPQPAEADTRDNEAWSRWAMKEGETIMAGLFGAEYAAKCRAATEWEKIK